MPCRVWQRCYYIYNQIQFTKKAGNGFLGFPTIEIASVTLFWSQKVARDNTVVPKLPSAVLLKRDASRNLIVQFQPEIGLRVFQWPRLMGDI